jgi:hypothetical protein
VAASAAVSAAADRSRASWTIFNGFKSSMISKEVQFMFKSSIPLHFDMLNATPYSLSKEGNSNLGGINRAKRSLNVQITIEKL